MIQFRADTQSGSLLGIGLTRATIAKLMSGEPLFFDISDLRTSKTTAPATNVVLFYGENEEDLFEAFRLAGVITDGTEVTRKTDA